MMFTSCLKTDELETSPECAMLSFAVGDVTTSVNSKTAAGNDTVIKKVLSGSSFKFNIDQVKGIITTIDSMPNWIDLSGVKPTFSIIGARTFIKSEDDGLYYLLTSGADSVNMTKPIELIVLASDGISTKKYTVSIKKSSYNNDSLIWNKGVSNLAVEDDFKTVVRGNRVFAFYTNGAGEVMTTNASTNTGLTSWTTPMNIKGAEIDYASLLLFKDEFYALGKDGCIYKAEEQNRPETWSKVGDAVYKKLLASDKYYIYALNESGIVGSADLQTWKDCGKDDIDMIPTGTVFSHSYESKTNADLQISMMCGTSDMNEEHDVAWYKVSSQDESTDQKWMYIQITKDNAYGMPKFKNMSVAWHQGCLYALGTEGNEGAESYKYIYISKDNGISWHTYSDTYPLPDGINKVKGMANIVSADGKIWIVQKGGNVWSGVIR